MPQKRQTDSMSILLAEKPIRSLKSIILFASFYTSAVDVFMGLRLKL